MAVLGRRCSGNLLGAIVSCTVAPGSSPLVQPCSSDSPLLTLTTIQRLYYSWVENFSTLTISMPPTSSFPPITKTKFEIVSWVHMKSHGRSHAVQRRKHMQSRDSRTVVETKESYILAAPSCQGSRIDLSVIITVNPWQGVKASWVKSTLMRHRNFAVMVWRLGNTQSFLGNIQELPSLHGTQGN